MFPLSIRNKFLLYWIKAEGSVLGVTTSTTITKSTKCLSFTNVYDFEIFKHTYMDAYKWCMIIQINLSINFPDTNYITFMFEA